MLFWWHWFSYRWSVGPTLYSCPFLGLDSCTLLFPVPENCVCCVGTLWEQGGGGRHSFCSEQRRVQFPFSYESVKSVSSEMEASLPSGRTEGRAIGLCQCTVSQINLMFGFLDTILLGDLPLHHDNLLEKFVELGALALMTLTSASQP